MICTMSKTAAEKRGYADAMMLDWRGYVAEATGANAQHLRGLQLALPLHANLRHDQVAAVALDLVA